MAGAGSAAKGAATEFGSNRMWGLMELPLPEPESWLPATWGWAGLAAALLALAGWQVWCRARAWQRDRYRREALKRIDDMRADPSGLRDLPTTLRSVALSAYPREEVAALRSQAWVTWLNANGGHFEPTDAGWLDRLPYDVGAVAQLAPETREHLLAASRSWVRGHHARL